VRSVKYAEAFFKTDAHDYPDEYYSHIPRWNTTAKIKTFFSESLKGSLQGYKNVNDLSDFLSEDLRGHDDLSMAQYIEIKTLLSGYLLSSQGDRVAMANSIEGRFPFLDHRVIEFACKLPPTMRMRALTEKYILKKSVRGLLPESIVKRTKQPYMAPDAKSFFHGERLEYVDELLSEQYLEESGYFNTKAVQMLIKKCRHNPVLGFKDNMAVVGIISTLLVHDRFIKNFDARSKRTTEQRTEDERYAGKVGDQKIYY
jgi:asparagine synthase (glutamine-hydrolysing)